MYFGNCVSSVAISRRSWCSVFKSKCRKAKRNGSCLTACPVFRMPCCAISTKPLQPPRVGLDLDFTPSFSCRCKLAILPRGNITGFTVYINPVGGQSSLMVVGGESFVSCWRISCHSSFGGNRTDTAPVWWFAAVKPDDCDAG